MDLSQHHSTPIAGGRFRTHNWATTPGDCSLAYEYRKGVVQYRAAAVEDMAHKALPLEPEVFLENFLKGPCQHLSETPPPLDGNPFEHIADAADMVESKISELFTLHSSVPLVDPPAPPYEEEEFNACAPRRSTDASLLYPTRNADSSDRYPPSTAASVCSTATNTPFASRAPSPLPFYYSGASSCSSDSESESESPSLGRPSRQPRWRTDEARRWWQLGFRSTGTEGWRRRRRWRDVVWGVRTCKRVIRRLVRHPLFPKTPVTILLTLLFLTIFGVSLTFLLIYILNPDKEPLPWRGYCTLPQHSGRPPSLSLSPTALLQTPLPTNLTPSAFPPYQLLGEVGVYYRVLVCVVSIDVDVELA
ncbi:hypothetical protein NUW54_g3590 [Trametes sanguinea]|uniref:Uncharacterized protein n=1 Tax=Trametes sanguinea TaxID=158606 RepID=A0ACC1Q3G5_9APHY|nr:hypothetical protein NUW54_g3590 [Trametes sanguinea]